MRESIFTQEEFIAQIGVSVEKLRIWEQQKLIRPVGYTDDHIPFYGSRNLVEAEHILKLEQLGYSPEEIEKIIKKVGLPKTKRGLQGRQESKSLLTVGALAEKVGISPRTIKHWEDKGILIPDMRSEGGFRLYPQIYVYLCTLIQDLQRFGYSLDEIKTISDYFRDFLMLQNNLNSVPPKVADAKLQAMLDAIDELFAKTDLLKKGIQRWEELLKKKKKEILTLKNLNVKRGQEKKGKSDA